MAEFLERPLSLENLPCYKQKRETLRRNYKLCLLRWRAERGLSRKDVAFALQISVEYLRKLETPQDETRASLAVLERMALFYDKELYELFLPRDENGILFVTVTAKKF